MFPDLKRPSSSEQPWISQSDVSIASEILGYPPARTVLQMEEALNRQAKMPSPKLGETLLALEAIDEIDLLQALEAQKTSPNQPLGEILVGMGVLTQKQLNIALARKMGYPMVDLDMMPIDPAVLSKLPYTMAMRYKLLPLCKVGDRIILASEAPTLQDTIKDDLAFSMQCKVRLALAADVDITEYINRAYQANGAPTAPAAVPPQSKSSVGVPTANSAPVKHQDRNPALVSIDGGTVDNLLQHLIEHAYEHGVSDVHIECNSTNGTVLIRMRQDGRLSTFERLSHFNPVALVQRIKVLCDLDISIRKGAQEGRLDYGRIDPKRPVTLLVKTVPTHNHSEDVVLRLLSTSKARDIQNIDLSHVNSRALQDVLSRPSGLVLCVGPSGSGQTTTLHSWLRHVNTDDRKVWTAEDPVEYPDPSLRQMQVNPRNGWSYAQAMEAILGADPDVIMVGDMRERQVAHLVVEASLNGHLMLSSMRTGSAAETITRLLDMGVDRFSLADSLQSIMGQRLVRRMCTDCRTSHPMTEHQAETLALEYLQSHPEGLRHSTVQVIDQWMHLYAKNDSLLAYQSVGCQTCKNTGYVGRMAIHELMVVDAELRQLIQSKADLSHIHEWEAQSSTFYSLRQDGIIKVLQGKTTIEEVHANCSA